MVQGNAATQWVQGENTWKIMHTYVFCLFFLITQIEASQNGPSLKNEILITDYWEFIIGVHYCLLVEVFRDKTFLKSDKTWNYYFWLTKHKKQKYVTTQDNIVVSDDN